jgi:hypothetical protein
MNERANFLNCSETGKLLRVVVRSWSPREPNRRATSPFTSWLKTAAGDLPFTSSITRNFVSMRIERRRELLILEQADKRQHVDAGARAVKATKQMRGEKYVNVFFLAAKLSAKVVEATHRHFSFLWESRASGPANGSTPERWGSSNWGSGSHSFLVPLSRSCSSYRLSRVY